MSDENVEVGIDLIQKVAKNVVDVILQFEKAKADDGEISMMEIVGFADEAIALAKNAIQYEAIKLQILDIDKEEGKELIDYIISLGVMPDKVQIILTNVFQIVEKSFDIYNDNLLPIIDVLKIWKE